MLKKKICISVCALLFILIFSGCGTNIDVSGLNPGIADAQISNIDITAKVESVEKDGESLYLNVVYQNDSDKDAVYGREPRLEILVDGKWYEMKTKDEAAWDAIGVFIIKNTSTEEKIDLNLYYDDLPSGHYRYLKKIDNFYRSAEFDL